MIHKELAFSYVKKLKLDHALSSCIVEMVYVVKVVNIVRLLTVRCWHLKSQATDHGESESGSRPR